MRVVLPFGKECQSERAGDVAREGVGQNVHGRIVEWKPIKHFFEPIGYKRENGAGTKMKFSMEDVGVVCRRELVQGKSIANVGPSYLRGHKVHRGGIPK